MTVSDISNMLRLDKATKQKLKTYVTRPSTHKRKPRARRKQTSNGNNPKENTEGDDDGLESDGDEDDSNEPKRVVTQEIEDDWEYVPERKKKEEKNDEKQDISDSLQDGENLDRLDAAKAKESSDNLVVDTITPDIVEEEPKKDVDIETEEANDSVKSAEPTEEDKDKALKEAESDLKSDAFMGKDTTEQSTDDENNNVASYYIDDPENDGDRAPLFRMNSIGTIDDANAEESEDDEDSMDFSSVIGVPQRSRRNKKKRRVVYIEEGEPIEPAVPAVAVKAKDVTLAEAQKVQPSARPKVKRKKIIVKRISEVYITHAEQIGDGTISATYLVYHIQVFFEDKTDPVICVRRYRQFWWLYNELANRFKIFLVPTPPQKMLIVRFGEQFMEYRRRELEKFLRRLVSHHMFKDALELHAFLQPTSVKEFTYHLTRPMLPKISAELNTSKPTEIDPWYDIAKDYLYRLPDPISNMFYATYEVAHALQTFRKSIEPLVEATQDLAYTEHNFDTGLQQQLVKLCVIIDHYTKLTRSTAEFSIPTLAHSLSDYDRMIEACHKIIAVRDRSLLLCEGAEQTSENRRKELNNHKRKEDVINFANSFFHLEYETYKAKRNFEKTDGPVKKELRSFFQNKSKEVKDALRTFIRGQMEYSLQNLAHWKELIGEVPKTAPVSTWGQRTPVMRKIT
eukprot:CAMPEP_0168515534 /NCGR_PEP_ID=MMETSP0405-20121227/4820_1 /TAXON_ID=498012 /ORGANISM="Trichosphaerium sp, Strain Am-I-7 wt" /LENGTH=681 /DNA_ID=CAMNT_0008534985 /DNA_START=109 /DNA_END=2154 /DNA_ORIENTATION=+